MRILTTANIFPGTILIDSREQHFYTFREIPKDRTEGGGTWQVLTKTVGLASGDYSLHGFADKIAVERKSLADLFSTIGQGRDRFERELERLDAMEFAAVVVEAEWSSIINEPPRHSNLTAKTIFRSVLAWQQRYPRCHWLFVPGREMGERTTFRILERFMKENAAKERAK